MEICYADCGCLVDRGVRLIACASADCCCLGLPLADPMETTRLDAFADFSRTTTVRLDGRRAVDGV